VEASATSDEDTPTGDDRITWNTDSTAPAFPRTRGVVGAWIKIAVGLQQSLYSPSGVSSFTEDNAMRLAATDRRAIIGSLRPETELFVMIGVYEGI